MADSSNQSSRILVVDRDTRVGKQLQEALAEEGYRSDHCASASCALTLARQYLPSLMIVDTNLDACNGFEFAKLVWAEYRQHDIPVIFVSQTPSAELLDTSRQVGGMYFLSKPIDRSVLLELVDKSLWMPHLIRRHIDSAAHAPLPRAPRVLSDRSVVRRPLTS